MLSGSPFKWENKEKKKNEVSEYEEIIYAVFINQFNIFRKQMVSFSFTHSI